MNEGREKEGLTGRRRRTFERDWSVGEGETVTNKSRACRFKVREGEIG